MIVFLDSNAYIANKYLFDEGQLKIIRTMLENGQITLLYTSITQGEVYDHIESDIKNVVQKYNSSAKDVSKWTRNRDDLNLIRLDEKELIQQQKAAFDIFLRQDGVELIPLNPIDAEKLVQDYFGKVPPFEEKKPSEFKDAMIVNALKKFRETVDEDICVVSADKGFSKALAAASGFQLFTKIPDLIKHFQKKEKIYSYVKNFLIEDAGFIKKLAEHFEGYEVALQYYAYWECNFLEIKEITCSIFFIDLSKTPAQVYVDVELLVTVEIEHSDENTWYYDEDIKDYVFENYVISRENHQIDAMATLNISFEEREEEILFTGYEICSDEKFPTLELNEDTMISYEILPDNDFVYCSRCGKPIGRIGEVDVNKIEGEPLCDICRDLLEDWS